MKILWLEKSGEHTFGVPHAHHEFRHTVAKYAECAYAGEGYPDHRPGERLQDTVKRVMPDADWVMDAENAWDSPKPKKHRYRIGEFVHDIHGNHKYGLDNPVSTANKLNEAEYDSVFLRAPLIYGTSYRPNAFIDTLKCDKHWVPYSVDIGKYMVKTKRSIDVSCIGATFACYPLRREIAKDLYYVARGHKVFVNCGERDAVTRSEKGEKMLVGKEYDDTLLRTRILIFDCSIYRYPLFKFFEGMAAGCMCMSDAPYMADKLGLTHRVSYAEITLLNWDEALQYYLDNPEDVERIAAQGRKIVKRQHNHDVRAKQLISILGRSP